MKSYLLTIAPLVIGILVVLVVSALRGYNNKHDDRVSLWVTIAALLLPALLSITLIRGTQIFGGSLLITEIGRGFLLVYLLLTALVVFLTENYFPKIHVNGTDWRLIVLCMSLGAVHLFFANDLPTVFMAFQLVSIPTYALTGFSRTDRRSNEAGMKYLILGLVTGALLLLGISFLYGATGQINLSEIRGVLLTPRDPHGLRELGIVALILLFAALFFKTATAPFHSYLLDVYQGSSFAAMAVIAVPAKIAYFALLSRLIEGPFLGYEEIWKPLIAAGAIFSFAFGGVQGLGQTNLKRILACSSVINTGFILLALAFAEPGVMYFYLFVYGLMTVALLGFWMYLGREYADVDSLGDLTGLSRREPTVAVGMTIALLSLAGIPLTAGFVSKFFVLLSVFQDTDSGDPAAIVTTLGILGSALAAYFYFGIIRTIWFRGEPPTIPVAAGASDRRWNYAFVAWLAVALVLLLGVYPFPLFR